MGIVIMDITINKESQETLRNMHESGAATDTTKRNRSITFDSLLVHASKLDLQSKVEIVRRLKEQIANEVKVTQETASAALNLAKDL